MSKATILGSLCIRFSSSPLPSFDGQLCRWHLLQSGASGYRRRLNRQRANPARPNKPVPKRNIPVGSGTATAWMNDALVILAVSDAACPGLITTSFIVSVKVPTPLELEKLKTCGVLLKSILTPPTPVPVTLPNTVAVYT